MYLGDVGQAYTDWVQQVQDAGGAAVTWPLTFNDQYVGLSAARYPSALYAQLYNARQIDPNAPQRASGSNAYVYVLASDAVQQASPETMTLWQKLQNAFFTARDEVADATGAPIGQGPGAVVSAILSIPRKLVGEVLGLPGWATTALIVGAGALVITQLAPRKNPRGRRRRHRRTHR